MRHSASRRRHGRRKASAGIRRRLLLVPAILLSLVLSVPTGALAFWTTTGGGAANGATGTLAPPTGVSATQQGQTSGATVSWLASPTSGVTGYRAERASVDGTTWTTVCTTVTALSCAGSGIADGRYQFRVVALRGSWTAPSAAPYAVATIDTVRPTVTVSRVTATPTRSDSLQFTAAFSEPVFGFTQDDVTIVKGTGVTGTPLITIAGTGPSYSVTVAGLTTSATAYTGGTVAATIAADSVTDGSGNGNTASTGAANSILLDRTAPAAPAAPTLTTDSAPPGTTAPSAYLTDRITNTLAFNGSVPSDMTNGTVRLYRVVPSTGAATLAETSSVGTATTYSVSDTELGAAASYDGTYNYFVTFTDELGNVSANGAQLVGIVVDRHAPAAATGLTVGRGLLGATVSGAATVGANDLNAVAAYFCPGDVTSCTSNAASGTITNGRFDATRLGLVLGGLGTWTAIVVQGDVAGNTVTSRVVF